MRWNVEVASWRTWWDSLSLDWKQALAEHFDLNTNPNQYDLQGLIDSTDLDLSGSTIYDLSPLSVFRHLEKLDLSNLGVRDLMVLAQLDGLRELHLTCSPSIDLTPITCLSRLEVLDLSYPQLPIQGSLNMLDELTSLRELYCNACQLKDVIPFVGMQHLELLSISFNPIPKEEICALRELLPNCRILA